jgi:hypothetical protein
MFLGEYQLGQTVAFNFQALDGNGSPIDPSAAPTYAVFCDNVQMAVNGTMTKVAGLTGFYGGQVAASSANGFEGGKSYTIRITAIVDGVTTTATQIFQLAQFASPSSPQAVPPVSWAPAGTDVFTAAAISLAVTCMNSFDAVQIIYEPFGQAERTINALITYLDPSQIGAPQGISPKLQISVLNNSQYGVLSTELDTGKDWVRVPLRVADSLSRRRISQIVSQDAGMLVLEVR